MKVMISKDVTFILEKLKKSGFEAYIVGGCVRDLILQKKPKDWDIVTSAKIHEIKEIFEKTIDTGIKHGTIVMVLNSINYEISTYKSNNYGVTDISFDLSRRDFTINSIAYNHLEGIIDPFRGMDDIEARVIKAVESPDDRFIEDPLRMLRALRFMAQLEFEVETHTFNAILKNSSLITTVSVERIREEITKILKNKPSLLETVREAGLLNYILPEFDQCFGVAQNHPYHYLDVARHTIKSIENVQKSTILTWTMLLHDIGKPHTKTHGKDGYDHFYDHGIKSFEIATKLLNKYKFDNKSIQRILQLVKYHDYNIGVSKKSVRRFLSLLGKDVLMQLLLVRKADALAQNIEMSIKKVQDSTKIDKIIQQIENAHECFDLKSLAICGDDLIEIGIKRGKNVGEILRYLLEMVIEKPCENTKENLIKIAQQFIEKQKK